jgi:hypothetical protein
MSWLLQYFSSMLRVGRGLAYSARVKELMLDGNFSENGAKACTDNEIWTQSTTYSYAPKVQKYSCDVITIDIKVTGILFLNVCAETSLRCV